MQYKYFTEKIFTKGGLDLSQVFVDKADIVKQQMNVDYGLADIALFLKEKSKNFTVADRYLMDFDYAIKEIVSRYYKSIGQDNPFITDEDKQELDKYQQGIKPREGVTLEDGKIKRKGKAVVEEPTPSESEAPKEKKVVTKDSIEKQIKALKYLAEKKNNESAKKQIKALSILLKRFK